MQLLLHVLSVHGAPNPRTTGLQSASFLLSIDATSSAKLENKIKKKLSEEQKTTLVK
jgi:hypothetical protein